MNILRRLSRTLSGLLIGPANVEEDSSSKTVEGDEQPLQLKHITEAGDELQSAADQKAPDATSPIVESGSVGDSRDSTHVSGHAEGEDGVEVSVAKTVIVVKPTVEDLPSAGEEEKAPPKPNIEQEDPEQNDIEFKEADIISERPDDLVNEPSRILQWVKIFEHLLKDVLASNKDLKGKTKPALRPATNELLEDIAIDFALRFLNDSKENHPDKQLTAEDLQESVLKIVPPGDILDCCMEELELSLSSVTKLMKKKETPAKKPRRVSEPAIKAAASPAVGDKRPRRASAVYKEEESSPKKLKTSKKAKKGKKAKQDIDFEVEEEKKPKVEEKVEEIEYSQPSRLIFPIADMLTFAKKRDFNIDVTYAAGLAALLDYFISEVLELGSNISTTEKKARLTSRHIYRGIVQDKEMSELMAGRIFANAGRVYADNDLAANDPTTPLIKAENCHGELVIPRGNFQGLAEEILDAISEKATKTANGGEKSKKKRKSTKKSSKKSSKKAKVDEDDSDEEEDESYSEPYTLSSQALSALQEAAEVHLIEVFERARYIAKYKYNRDLLMANDMKEVNREFITSIKSLNPKNGKEFSQFVNRYSKKE